MDAHSQQISNSRPESMPCMKIRAALKAVGSRCFPECGASSAARVDSRILRVLRIDVCFAVLYQTHAYAFTNFQFPIRITTKREVVCTVRQEEKHEKKKCKKIFRSASLPFSPAVFPCHSDHRSGKKTPTLVLITEMWCMSQLWSKRTSG